MTDPPHEARSAGFHDDGPRTGLVIDCATCIGPEFGACEDCVVTFLCDRDPEDAVVIDVAEARALRTLAEADLVPGLRHREAGAHRAPTVARLASS